MLGFALTVVCIVIMVACLGVVGTDGLWHSLITFFNVLTAAVLATNYFEPAATWLDSKMPTFSYLVDFVVLWGLFIFFGIVFRLLTGWASKIKVRFMRSVDMIGGALLSLWTGWLMVCFLMMSLHVAPLSRSPFGGAFQPEPEARMFFSLAPDHQWLAFMHKLSVGQFAKTPPRDDADRFVFDPQGKFILTYAARRAAFETTQDLRVRRTFGSGIVEEGEQILGP